MQSLFRNEVMEAKHRQWLGGIMIASPPSRWSYTALAAALASSLIALMFLGKYTRHETVLGQLVPTSGLAILTAKTTGTIAFVFVKTNQIVRRGDPLVEISSEENSVALGDMHALVAHQLNSQKERLQSDLVGSNQLFRQQDAALREKIKLLRAQLGALRSQSSIQSQQALSAQNLLERIKPLADKGFVSAFQVQQQEATLLDARAQQKNLTRQGLDLQEQLASILQQLAQLPIDASTRENDIQRKLADIQQSSAQNEVQRAVLLRAPQDGTISSLSLKPGQTVSAGQSVVSLVPRGSLLLARLLVPSRSIGFIQPGTRVVLRYQAFPYQKFGQHFGRVENVSRSALTPDEVAAMASQKAEANQDPLYLVEVKLESQGITAYGKSEDLRAGMALDADILMDRRTLIEWVFEPLYGLKRRWNAGNEHG
jgi:membrane fusion protein